MKYNKNTCDTYLREKCNLSISSILKFNGLIVNTALNGNNIPQIKIEYESTNLHGPAADQMSNIQDIVNAKINKLLDNCFLKKSFAASSALSNSYTIAKARYNAYEAAYKAYVARVNEINTIKMHNRMYPDHIRSVPNYPSKTEYELMANKYDEFIDTNYKPAVDILGMIIK